MAKMRRWTIDMSEMTGNVSSPRYFQTKHGKSQRRPLLLTTTWLTSLFTAWREPEETPSSASWGRLLGCCMWVSRLCWAFWGGEKERRSSSREGAGNKNPLWNFPWPCWCLRKTSISSTIWVQKPSLQQQIKHCVWSHIPKNSNSSFHLSNNVKSPTLQAAERLPLPVLRGQPEAVPHSVSVQLSSSSSSQPPCGRTTGSPADTSASLQQGGRIYGSYIWLLEKPGAHKGELLWRSSCTHWVQLCMGWGLRPSVCTAAYFANVNISTSSIYQILFNSKCLEVSTCPLLAKQVQLSS